MAEYLIQEETLTSIADKIRILNGTEDAMTTAQMVSSLGEANTEVANQAALISEQDAKIAELAEILSGKAGGSEPTLQEKTVTPSTSKQTVTADSGYDGLSQVTVNAMTTATQATPSISVSSSGLITASATQSAGYVAAGTKSATKQLTTQAAKTVTPSTSSQTAVSSGVYTTGAVTVAAVTTQEKTATPTTSVQEITPDSGKFLSKVIVNEIPSSYGVYKSIFNKTITEFTDNELQDVSPYAFYNCTKLTSVSFPNVTYINSAAFMTCATLKTISFPSCIFIGSSAFTGCYSLTTADFPKATNVGASAFAGCYSISTVNLPVCTDVYAYAFYNCSNALTSVELPACTGIASSAFCQCYNLTTVSLPSIKSIFHNAFAKCRSLSQLYLPGSSVCALKASNAFSSTPFAGYSAYFSGTPYIYVPASLIDSYKTATNWTYFSSRFVGI